MATIKVRPNGPLVVEGDDVTVVDASGNEFPIAKRPFVLCRCGASLNKPFCDATHRQIGFAAPAAASGDKPAT